MTNLYFELCYIRPKKKLFVSCNPTTLPISLPTLRLFTSRHETLKKKKRKKKYYFFFFFFF